MKASRWWKDRDTITASLSNKRRKSGTNKAISSVCQRGPCRRLEKKAMDGRGRKRQTWVTWLYAELVVEFDRLRKAGLKYRPMALRIVAKTILRTSQSEFHSAFRDLLNGKTLDERITPRWIQSFQEYNNIFIRTQTGKLMTSPSTQLQMEKRVSYHLG